MTDFYYVVFIMHSSHECAPPHAASAPHRMPHLRAWRIGPASPHPELRVHDSCIGVCTQMWHARMSACACRFLCTHVHISRNRFHSNMCPISSAHTNQWLRMVVQYGRKSIRKSRCANPKSNVHRKPTLPGRKTGLRSGFRVKSAMI